MPLWESDIEIGYFVLILFGISGVVSGLLSLHYVLYMCSYTEQKAADSYICGHMCGPASENWPRGAKDFRPTLVLFSN